MRVALIGPVPPQLGGATPGGVATHQLHLAAGLAAAGVDAAVLATNTRAEPAEWRTPADSGVPVARAAAAEWPTAARGGGPLALYRMARPAWGSAQYRRAVGESVALRYASRLVFTRPEGSRREILEQLLWYRRFLAGVRPELIHVQHPLERCLYARTVKAYERWTLPLVVTAHSLSGEHRPDVIQTLMAPNLKAADRVIAVSPHIAREAIELGVDAARVRVIRSGVDVDQFRPRDSGAARLSLGVGPGTPLVLFVGNLEPRKQIDVLLRAMARVHDVVPEARLIVVGSGESAGVEDQTARLLRLTGELELTNVVRFVGRIDDRQLQDCYAAADVFVLPSTSEAQGIVALEAMASGLPVIAAAVGGLVGTIEDGTTGFLVPSGDVEALTRPLLRLIEDRAVGRSIGAAARQAVERDFTWKQAIAATLDVYRDALTGEGRRRLVANGGARGDVHG